METTVKGEQQHEPLRNAIGGFLRRANRWIGSRLSERRVEQVADWAALAILAVIGLAG